MSGDPGAIRGRAKLAKRIRGRATPSFGESSDDEE